MKKKYLTCAGIISAVILTWMFIMFFVTPVFLFPSITINPITDNNVDANNRLILTGTTTIPDRSFIVIKVNRSSHDPPQDTVSERTRVQGYVQIIPQSNGKNLWKGIVDLSSLQPAEYTLTFVNDIPTENYTKLVESEAIATRRFTLGDEKSGMVSIRKKTIVKKPFIRINTPEVNASAGNWEITGITSFEPGTFLIWITNEITTGMEKRPVGPSGVTRVTRGIEGINRWSFMINTSNFQPARYRVTVTGKAPGQVVAGSLTDEISGSAEFTPAIPVIADHSDPGHGSSGFITIDSLPDMRSNDVYLITGTTSLHAGEPLSFGVLPYSSGRELDFFIDPMDKSQTSKNPFSGKNGMVEVAEGSGITNLWALTLETYMMEPGMYEIRIDNNAFDFTTRRIIPGGLNSSRIFTIKDGIS
jgi:hypothetical protein